MQPGRPATHRRHSTCNHRALKQACTCTVYTHMSLTSGELNICSLTWVNECQVCLFLVPRKQDTVHDMHCASKGCGVNRPLATIRHEIQAGPHKDEQPVASQPCNLQQHLQASAQPYRSTCHHTAATCHLSPLRWQEGRGCLCVHKDSQLCSKQCQVCDQSIRSACRSAVCSLLLRRIKH